MGITQWVPRVEILEEDEQFEQVHKLNEQIVPDVKKEQTDTVNKDTNKPNQGSLTSKHYLKLVNWQNQVVQEEGCKKLLIICRHQIDQPASSFATSSPSQFMLDYINSLLSFFEAKDCEIKLQLAHLASVDLNDDSLELSNHVNNIKPDAVFVLGGEALKQLLGKEIEVSQYRGQVIDFNNKQKLIASYHPYSLITNPSLKPLALEDLKELTNYLFSIE